MVSGLGGRGVLRAITFAEPSWPGGGHAARLARWRVATSGRVEPGGPSLRAAPGAPVLGLRLQSGVRDDLSLDGTQRGLGLGQPVAHIHLAEQSHRLGEPLLRRDAVARPAAPPPAAPRAKRPPPPPPPPPRAGRRVRAGPRPPPPPPRPPRPPAHSSIGSRAVMSISREKAMPRSSTGAASLGWPRLRCTKPIVMYAPDRLQGCSGPSPSTTPSRARASASSKSPVSASEAASQMRAATDTNPAMPQRSRARAPSTAATT